MADPNNLLIHDRRLCLMLACKAGNTSIKWAVAAAMGLDGTHRTDLYWPTPNKADAAGFRDRGYVVAGIVRHPLARLASCWRDKVAERLHAPFRRRYGGAIRRGMAFGEFARVVASIPDGLADQHFRSLTWDMVWNSRPVPDFIFKSDAPGWWDALRGLLRTRCALEIGPERRENVTGGDWRALYDAETRAIAAARYREDFTWFGYDDT